ncbi:CPBP family intramembrane metalloprotease [Pontibacter sp. FD36]|uniref:CPBP family glutamic-type intramembrane protease n=1 Tax=Pontibacter sp. FD36 TaxID=2789860 RepID=UPI0018AC2B89|nr:CPBP family glutamic-type intramembrane protease [Pontibacter sp. FD36]MBF8962678.1 CPBP family intramembrane metalloprotease [Pontibacter sp. FD36]
MITNVKTKSQPQVKTKIPVATVSGVVLALLGPTMLVLLASYLKLGFIGSELFFWGLTLAILIIVRVWERKPFSSIGFQRFTLKDAGWAIVFAAALFLSFPVIYGTLIWLEVPVATEMFKAIGALPVPILCLLALRAGVTDEILNRGFLIERLLLITNNKVVAAVLPLLIFIMSHLAWGVAHLLFVTVGGILLTLLYFWKRNLWLNIICHFVVDLSLFLIMPSQY